VPAELVVEHVVALADGPVAVAQQRDPEPEVLAEPPVAEHAVGADAENRHVL
jgi:hypothetical protein